MSGAPRSPLDRLAAGTRAQRVGGERIARNASPIPEQASAVAAALAGTSAGAGDPVPWQTDRFVLTGSGAQTKALTYLPLDSSLFVFLNGVEQDEGTGRDWTVADQTLSVLSGMDARTSDVLVCKYQYLEGVPVLAHDEAVAMTDNFNRTGDLNGSSTTTGGGVWSVANGAWSGTGAYADCTSVTSGSTGLSPLTVECNSPDGTITASWGQVTGIETRSGLVLRATADMSSFIFIDRNGRVYLITDNTTYNPSVPTPAVFADLAIYWNSVGSVTAEMVGDTITLTSGASSDSFSTTFNQSETCHGFACNSAGASDTEYPTDWAYTP